MSMRNIELPLQNFSTRLDANDASPRETPGMVRTVFNPAVVSNSGTVTMIGFGECRFKYLQANAALASWTLGSLPAGTDVDNVAAGSSTTQITTTGLTADDLIYTLVVVYDNAGGAAVPEQEVVMAVRNTTTQIFFDVDTPLSSTLEANDDIRTVRLNQVEAGAALDPAATVQGFVIGDVNASTTGISAKYWGWVMERGLIRKALVVDGETPLENGAVAAGASGGVQLSDASDDDEVLTTIGHFVADGQTSLATDYAPVFIDVYSKRAGAAVQA